MYKRIKNNLSIYITIIVWLILTVIISFVMSRQIANTKPKQVPPEQTLDLNPTHVKSAVEFSTNGRLTAPSSSVTLDSSESARTQ